MSVCVVSQERKVRQRRNFRCQDPERIGEFFEGLEPFRAVVEATASYEWLVSLIEPLAERVVPAHPKKMRIIAESARKSDKLDAQVLAEFLAMDMIPESFRPPKRQRAHRVLVRHRNYLSRRLTSVRNKIRRILSDYNADREDLFSEAGLVYLGKVSAVEADRFVLDQLADEFQTYARQLREADKRLSDFAKEAPIQEAEAQGILDRIPCVGPVTIDVVVSELVTFAVFVPRRRPVRMPGWSPASANRRGERVN